MAAADAPAALQVEVVYCPAPHRIDAVRLSLPPGSTVADALRASGLLQRHPELAAAPALDAGVWCRAAAPEAGLRDRDRVEVYRPLTVDPKEARRIRYKRRGASKPPAAAPRSGG